MWLICTGQQWVTPTQIMSSWFGFCWTQFQRIIQTLWENDEDLIMCICSSIFLAELLAAAGAANDTVACLLLLIYLCVLEWGAEPAEVWRNDYRALRHPGIDRCQLEASGRLLRPPPSRKSLPTARCNSSIREITTTVRRHCVLYSDVSLWRELMRANS